eukprot:gene5052-34843_t
MSGAATELVTFNAEKKIFEVNPAAVKSLQKIHGPVAVVSVCGRARQGKSTLLNQLLGKLSSSKGSRGFTSADSEEDPRGQTLSSASILQILVDCEGIDAFDQTMDYSTQIFSLGVLLSSLLVFNQMGSIDESSIDKLSSVCEFAKLIRAKSSEGGGTGARDAAELSPSFLWLLRDFHYQLKEDGHEITAKDYMEEVLQDMNGSSESVKNRNQLFPDRDCVSLVRPLTDEAQLANMDTMPFDSLRPEFRQGLNRLTDSIVARAQPKTFRGTYVTGSALAAFALAYCQVINTGKVPMISSTWQGVIQGENQRALDASLAVYERAFNNAEGVPAETDALDKAHQKALAAAMDIFNEQALGDPAERHAFEVRLTESSGSRYRSVRQAKLAEADSRLTEMLAKATSRRVAARQAKLAEAYSRLTAMLAKATSRSASGPSKYKRIAEFMMNTLIRCSLEAAKKAQVSVSAASHKTEAVQKELAEAKARASELSSQLREASSSDVKIKQQLTAQQAEVARINNLLSESSRKATEAELRRDALSREVMELKERAAKLTSKASSLEGLEGTLRSQLQNSQSEVTRLSAESAERGRQLESTKSDAGELRSQLNSVMADKRSTEGLLDTELKRFRSEVQQACSSKQTAESELTRLKFEMASLSKAKEDEGSRLRSELATASQSAARGEQSRNHVSQLQQQLADQQKVVAEKDLAIQRLHQEREFLQQQYDSLRRTSISPIAAATGVVKRGVGL